jgi:catechol 2,3-dioxygenase-like lactoylglutathione lyase family enzyme
MRPKGFRLVAQLTQRPVARQAGRHAFQGFNGGEEMATATDYGKPPRNGWAGLVPELLVTDIAASLAFWRDALGFSIAYQRPEQKFAYLERAEGAQVMLCQRAGNWETGLLEQPFGRGIMLQIFVGEISSAVTALATRGWPIHTGPREVWRRYGDREGGKRELVVQDPDGYLILLAESLGERPLPRI